MRKEAKSDSRPDLIVGRTAEVGYLEQCLDVALRGERQVVFVSGEPGIGKTTIVDAFLKRISTRTDLQFGRGQCIEQYGAGEAYLPLLEIAGQLCHGPAGDRVRTLLRQYAPSWLVQLPFLLEANEYAALQLQLQGATRERMMREAAEAMVQFTRDQGYVLVLEDLHWSDGSTLEWLSYIAQRREPAKLLLIGTYRPTDVLVSGHPLRGVAQDLKARGQCEELCVAPVTEEVVLEYISERFGGVSVPVGLAAILSRRTGGNPLFLVNLVQYLVDRGVLQREGKQLHVREDLVAVANSVPDSLRQLIEKQLERLPDNTQRLLEVASVVGVEFSAAAVAAGLQHEVEDIEEQCNELARKNQFIRAQGTEEWPDGALSEQYSFLHAFYHAVLYGRVMETQRVRLHRRVAVRKEAAYGDRVGEIATELGMHCEARTRRQTCNTLLATRW
jgi:predicted ATPase